MMINYRKLLKENEQLRQRLKKYENNGRQNIATGEHSSHLTTAWETYYLHSAKSYFGYIKRYVKRSDPYRLYKRASEYFRPIRYTVRFFRWLFIILTWIQASALLLVLAVLLFSALPLILIILAVISVVVRIDAQKMLYRDSETLRGKSVIVFFQNANGSDFFLSNAIDMSKKYAVIIVGANIPKNTNVIKRKVRKRFLNRKRLTDNILLVHEHYFFLLRNKLLENAKSVSFVF